MMRLAANELACVRGGREIFQGLGFAVGAGETLAVTGPNGAGKSSLLRLIAGLIRPSRGQVMLEGGVADLSIGEQSHYLGHLDALKSSLTVAENLAFWRDFFGGTKEIDDLLRQVGLEGLAHLPAAYLSAGQRRRLGLARLLATERPIWLLDEPSASLDTAGQELLARMMGTHVKQGGMIAVATHGQLGPGAVKELRLGSRGPLVGVDEGQQR